MSTFALVAGGGHNAWCWERLIPELEERGHQAIAVTLPTSDPNMGLAGFADAVVSSVAHVQGDLVLVGHSLAGRYLPLAASRLPGARLVFLCAIVAEEDEEDQAVDGWIQPMREPREPSFDGEGRQLPLPDAAAVLYPDCDDATVAWAMAQVVPTSLRVMREPFPRGGWRPGIASAYIMCTEDQAIVPEWAREYARRLDVKPIELPGGHCLLLSRPAFLANVLVDLLEDDVHWSIHP